jgi:hypothetical protein
VARVQVHGPGRLYPGAALRCAGRTDDGLGGAHQLVVDVPEGAQCPARGGHHLSGAPVAVMAVTSFTVRDGLEAR